MYFLSKAWVKTLLNVFVYSLTVESLHSVTVCCRALLSWSVVISDIGRSKSLYRFNQLLADANFSIVESVRLLALSAIYSSKQTATVVSELWLILFNGKYLNQKASGSFLKSPLAISCLIIANVSLANFIFAFVIGIPKERLIQIRGNYPKEWKLPTNTKRRDPDMGST